MSCRWCPLDDLQSLWRNGWVLSKKSCKNLFHSRHSSRKSAWPLGAWKRCTKTPFRRKRSRWTTEGSQNAIQSAEESCFLPTKAAPGAVATVQHVWLEIGLYFTACGEMAEYVMPPQLIICTYRANVETRRKTYLWWRWRRNVSFSISASLSLFSALTLYSHAHLWSIKLSLKKKKTGWTSNAVHATFLFTNLFDFFVKSVSYSICHKLSGKTPYVLV